MFTTVDEIRDPASQEFLPAWRVESNELGSALIALDDVAGNFIAVTQIPPHEDAAGNPRVDDPLTIDVVEGQTPGVRPAWYVRAADWVQRAFSPGAAL